MTISDTTLPDRSKSQAVMRGLKCTCPNCAEGKLFDKWLKVTPECSVCGEQLHHERAQDFPPYITIMIVGHVIVTLLMMVEANFVWSLTTHLLVWIPLSTAMTLAIMQPVKGGVVGFQWAVRMFGFGDTEERVEQP
ncbi:DUF983 domain-containing protein [Ahrensia sp. R2A130]|uniref:DUF983 domain-containing protein n=1 Tax=Ahrensia sp. R2A130 TaxID=744979 RepID=UPI0001E0BC26|nr:DUF983 domain-containing protein [Ahrensia sp. R2A130]EFL90185.1 zinc-finger protein [Ahrensia sp. R2A130]